MKESRYYVKNKIQIIPRKNDATLFAYRLP